MAKVFGRTNEVTNMRVSGSKIWPMGRGRITGVTEINTKASGSKT